MRLTIAVDLDYAIIGPPTDVLLQIEAAATPDQRIVAERLTIWSDHPIAAVAGEDGVGQRCWIRAEQWLKAEYRATVDVKRAPVDLAPLRATPVRELAGALVPYLLPSRYCQSDRLEGFVRRRFAGLEGGALAAALAAWVQAELEYRSNTSSGETTALDTFASRSGVCRDYAHLLVALARAGRFRRAALPPMRRGSIRPISMRSPSCGWTARGGWSMRPAWRRPIRSRACARGATPPISPS